MQAVLLLAAGLVWGTALAASEREYENARGFCLEHPNSDYSVVFPAHLVAAGCTILINAGREPPRILAEAHARLGLTEIHADLLISHFGTPGSVLGCERALANFDSALRLDPGHPRAHRGRAMCYRSSRRFEEALSEYNMALPRTPESERWQIYHARADTLMFMGRHADATTSFDMAIRLAPHVARNYHDRAASWFLQDQLDRALADMNHVIELTPNDPGAYYGRAQIYQRRGDSVRAQQDMARARELAPRGQAVDR